MMFVDFWRWCQDYDLQAWREGHPQKKQLLPLMRQAERLKDNARFDEALQILETGLVLAQKLHEPCWEMLFESLIAETHIYYRADKQAGLDRLVRAATRSYQEAYQQCLMRARVLCNLAAVYFDRDFFGYEDQIREMLDVIANDVPLDEDTYLRMKQLKADFLLEHEQYDAAYEAIQALMPEVEGRPFRERTAYYVLHRIAFAKGDIPLALDYAKATENYAIQCYAPRRVAEAILWIAAYERHLHLPTAWHSLQRGLGQFQQYDLPRADDYYNALCDYYEQDGHRDKALQLREEQVAVASKIGSASYVVEAHLEHCRLLGRMGRPLDGALENARNSTADLLKPDVYLDRLKRIENGDYFQFDWQRGQHDQTN